MGSQGGEDMQQGGGWQGGQGAGWRNRQSHICMWIRWRGGQLGSKTDHATHVSSAGKQSLKTSGCKNLRGLQRWEKLPVSQESPLEEPKGS